jgi:excisionase family DNA binding protein
MTKFRHDKSTGEVAEMLDLTPRQVARLAACGDIPAFKLPGKTGSYLFNEADVRSYHAARQAARS